VLFILIPAALVAAVALGVSMCRLAALSDRNHASALADWMATAYRAERQAWTAERLSEELPFDSRGETFRAAG
jgi:hypothetical protein